MVLQLYKFVRRFHIRFNYTIKVCFFSFPANVVCFISFCTKQIKKFITNEYKKNEVWRGDKLLNTDTIK